MMFVSFNSNTTGVTCGEGTVNPSGAHDLWFSVWSFVDVVCPFVLFLLVVVLSVLWFAASYFS